MVQPKLSSHQVKLADLWLRERTHLENQLMACRTDMERELGRTERRIKKVVSWMSDRSREKETMVALTVVLGMMVWLQRLSQSSYLFSTHIYLFISLSIYLSVLRTI